MEVSRLVTTGMCGVKKVIENPNAQNIKSALNKKYLRQCIEEFVKAPAEKLSNIDKLNTDVEPSFQFSFGRLREKTEAALAATRKRAEEMAKESGFELDFREIKGRESAKNVLYTTPIDRYLEQLRKDFEVLG